MSDMEYNAVAYLRPPLGDLTRISTRDRGRAPLVAETPQSAARKWYARQGDDERAAIYKVIVWAHKPYPSNSPVYEGPTIVFKVEAGKLVQVEVRDGAPNDKKAAAIPKDNGGRYPLKSDN